MNVSLKPELAKFVTEEVRTGHFSSAAEVVEAALGRLMLDGSPGSIDTGDVEDIRKSLEQVGRGEVVSWPELAARLCKKHLNT